MITVVIIDWHLNVTQSLRISLLILRSVTTVLEIDEGLFTGSGVLSDEYLQFFDDLLKLIKVYVLVML